MLYKYFLLLFFFIFFLLFILLFVNLVSLLGKAFHSEMARPDNERSFGLRQFCTLECHLPKRFSEGVNIRRELLSNMSISEGIRGVLCHS